MGKVIIIGGGLAGLISAIQLTKAGIPCLLIEKKSYPLHRVCGEYISNETVPFLTRENLFPGEFSPPNINSFVLTSVTGRRSEMKLPLGGFGISRYSLDNFLYEKARALGVDFMLNTEVLSLEFSHEIFTVTTSESKFESSVVIGCFGKRSKLDVQLKRAFIAKRSPFLGIKYHVRGNHESNQIALHNFDGGYCGINNVEDGISNICYLTKKENLQRWGTIPEMESKVLFKNPFLNKIFSDADFLFNKPEVINEISFEAKAPVENHVLMAGDSAGMIAPLCGNGMAIAIHSAKIASEIIPFFLAGKISREEMELRYTALWKKNFSARLWRGRTIQKLFGNETLSNLAVNLVLYSKPLASQLVRSTHGEPF